MHLLCKANLTEKDHTQLAPCYLSMLVTFVEVYLDERDRERFESASTRMVGAELTSIPKYVR